MRMNVQCFIHLRDTTNVVEIYRHFTDGGRIASFGPYGRMFSADVRFLRARLRPTDTRLMRRIDLTGIDFAQNHLETLVVVGSNKSLWIQGAEMVETLGKMDEHYGAVAILPFETKVEEFTYRGRAEPLDDKLVLGARLRRPHHEAKTPLMQVYAVPPCTLIKRPHWLYSEEEFPVVPWNKRSIYDREVERLLAQWRATTEDTTREDAA